MFACQNFAHGEPNDVFVIKGSPNIITDVADDPVPLTPEGFHLDQNYPNPFNASTVISFELPKRGRVSLEVFDIIGRKVCTLVDDKLDVGVHRVTWECNDCASGVYLIRLTANELVETRKMLLVK